jgi:hypothetical protein
MVRSFFWVVGRVVYSPTLHTSAICLWIDLYLGEPPSPSLFLVWVGMCLTAYGEVFAWLFVLHTDAASDPN